MFHIPTLKPSYLHLMPEPFLERPTVDLEGIENLSSAKRPSNRAMMDRRIVVRSFSLQPKMVAACTH